MHGYQMKMRIFKIVLLLQCIAFLLFLVYMVDLHFDSLENTAMYADDVAIWDSEPAVVRPALAYGKPWSINWILPTNDS